MCLSSTGRAADKNDRRPKTSSDAIRWRRRQPLLLQRIDRESTEKLGIEVSRFLRQNFAGRRNIADLLHPNRVHKKRNLHSSTPHLLQTVTRLATVQNVLLVPHRSF